MVQLHHCFMELLQLLGLTHATHVQDTVETCIPCPKLVAEPEDAEPGDGVPEQGFDALCPPLCPPVWEVFCPPLCVLLCPLRCPGPPPV